VWHVKRTDRRTLVYHNTSCLKDGRIKTYRTSKSLNTKKRQYMALEIQIIVWDRHKNVAGLNHILHSIKVSCFKEFWGTICFYTSVFKTGRIMVYQCPSIRPFHMSHSNLRTPWPIHFKFHRVIGIDGLTVCILFGEISIFHSRVMGLYSSNCRQFFVCRAENWEPPGQFTSSLAQLLV
jgi:hypothetical protein